MASETSSQTSPGNRPQLRGRHRPLHITIVRFVIVLVLLTAVGIGFFTYRNTRNAVTVLSDELITQITQRTEDKVNDFLRPASVALDQMGQQMTLQARYGVFDPIAPGKDNWKARANLCLRVLRENPQFYWVFYGDRAGNFSGAHRDSQNRITLEHRWIEGGATQWWSYSENDLNK